MCTYHSTLTIPDGIFFGYLELWQSSKKAPVMKFTCATQTCKVLEHTNTSFQTVLIVEQCRTYRKWLPSPFPMMCLFTRYHLQLMVIQLMPEKKFNTLHKRFSNPNYKNNKPEVLARQDNPEQGCSFYFFFGLKDH